MGCARSEDSEGTKYLISYTANTDALPLFLSLSMSRSDIDQTENDNGEDPRSNVANSC